MAIEKRVSALLAHLSILLVQLVTFAQEPESSLGSVDSGIQESPSADVEAIWEDQFTSPALDTNYTTAGPDGALVLGNGRLNIRDEGLVSRGFDAADWVELQASLTFADLTIDGQTSATNIRFGNESHVVLEQAQEHGQTRSSISVFATPANRNEKKLSRKVRSFEFNTALPNGMWRITCRHGLWSIRTQNSEGELLFQAFIEKDIAAIDEIRVSQEGRPLQVERWAILIGNRTVDASLLYNQQQKDQLARILNAGVAAYSKGDLDLAIRKFEEGLDILVTVTGNVHPDFATNLNRLANLYARKGDYIKALELGDECREIRKQLLGGDHPNYAMSVYNQANIQQSNGQYESAKPLLEEVRSIHERVFGTEHYLYAMTLTSLAGLYRNTGEFRKAIHAFEEAEQCLAAVVGTRHPKYAAVLNSFANLLADMGAYDRALPMYTNAIEIWSSNPLNSAEHASSLNNLGMLYTDIGLYDQALELLNEVRSIREKVPGTAHPAYAMCLNNIGGVYWTMGEYDKALPLIEQARDIHGSSREGKEHPDYATILNALGMLYASMGDYEQAIIELEKSRAIWAELPGKKHPLYATSLNNIATTLQQTGAFEQALDFLEEASQIRSDALGKKHPDFAASLNNLANLHQDMGDYKRAIELQRQALAVQKNALGEQHPDFGNMLNNLGTLYRQTGDFEPAVDAFQESLYCLELSLGKDHPKYAAGLGNLANLYKTTGDLDKALPLFEEAGARSVELLETTSVVQTESQQYQMAELLRGLVKDHVSTVVLADVDPDQAYSTALRWKGATFVRQRWMRMARELDDADLERLFTEFQSVTAMYASFKRSQPKEHQYEAYQRQIQELGIRREKLDRQLIAASASYRKTREYTRTGVVGLLDKLPDNVALVDVTEYSRRLPENDVYGLPQTEPGLCAFVIKKGTKVELIELGSRAEIERLIGEWQRTIDKSQDAGHNQAAGALRKLLLDPILTSIADVELVLISPEGLTGRLPWMALPGTRPGTFVCEEVAIAVLPVPQLISGSIESQGESGQASLLAIGGVDFDSSLDLANSEDVGSNQDMHPAVTTERSGRAVWMLRSAPRPRDGSTSYRDLPETKVEIERIAELFRQRFPGGRVVKLVGQSANEVGVRENAPQHRFLHIASHGFFANLFGNPDSDTDATTGNSKNEPDGSGLTGKHPGLLSGIVLAGANQPVVPGKDDGILTALEVATLDLGNVELAVLSACETGLGTIARGEGVLGLQRAFQISGARTTVASLWKVDDVATRLLMERFYTNLLVRNMGKLDALREAQLWLLYNPQVAITGDLSKEVWSPGDSPPESGVGRTPPGLWAAWVLSGDWR